MENVFKSWFTTLLGCACMVLALYEWYIGEEQDWYQVAIPFIAGFMLLYMRDNISEFLTEYIKSKISKKE